MRIAFLDNSDGGSPFRRDFIDLRDKNGDLLCLAWVGSWHQSHPDLSSLVYFWTSYTITPGEHSPGLHTAGGDRHPHLLLLHSLWHAGVLASWISLVNFFKEVHEPPCNIYNKRQCDQSCSNAFSTFSVSSANTVHQRAIRNFQTGKIVNSEIRRTPETPDTCNAETYKAIHEPLEKKSLCLSIPLIMCNQLFFISLSLEMFWLFSTYTKHPNYWT